MAAQKVLRHRHDASTHERLDLRARPIALFEWRSSSQASELMERRRAVGIDACVVMCNDVGAQPLLREDLNDASGHWTKPVKVGITNRCGISL
jgi:hypothetical protein